MKRDFVMPILVLTLICIIVSGALAVTNSFTAPVIYKAAREREEKARREIIPEAESFERVETEGLPDTVKEVYATTNGAGYIFMIVTSGYGGEMRLICGVGPDGKIIHCSTLAHGETKGLGSRISEDAFQNQFDGKDSGLEGISAITGATISSNAYINAVKDAFAAYEIVREMEQ